MPVGDTEHYKNPEVDKLMDQAAREPDHDKRVAMYKTLQHQILEDAPWVFVNSVLQVRAARKEVKGFRLNPTQMFFDMDQVSLER
jgi:peptide/nickel transport system substrate-binding protein